MADFNESVPDVNIPDSRVAPVTNDSASQAVNAVGGLLGGVGVAVANAQIQNQQLAQAKAKAMVVNQLQENLLRHGDLVDQGVENYDAARRSSRRLLASALANNPGMSKELTEAYNTALTSKGMAANLIEGTQADQDTHTQKLAVFADMQKTGLVPANMNPDSPEADAAMSAYQTYRLHATQLEDQVKQIQAKRAAIGLDTDVVQLANAKQSYVTGGITQKTARLNLYQKQAEVSSQQAITGGAAAFNQLYSGKLADIYSQWKAGKIDAQDASLAVDQASAQMNGMAQQVAPNAGGAYIGNVLKPMQDLGESMKGAFTGKIDAESAQNALTTTTTRMGLQVIHNNPDVLPIIATAKMLPQVPTEVLGKMTSDAFKMIGFDPDTGAYKGSTPSSSGVAPAAGTNPGTLSGQVPSGKPVMPNYVAPTGDVKAAVIYIKSSLQAINSGATKDPDAIKETNNALITAAKSAIKYGPTADNSADYNSLIDLTSSPDFATYSKSGKFTGTQEDMNKVAEAMRQSYDRDVVPLIRQEFVNSNVSLLGAKNDPFKNPDAQPDTTEAKASSQIHAMFDGNGIKFVVNSGVNSNDSVYLNKVASNLTTNVGPVFNRFIKSQANLSGTDLKTQFDLFSNNIMGSDEPTSTQ